MESLVHVPGLQCEESVCVGLTEVQDTANHQIWNLGNDEASYKCDPAVHFRLFLSRFVDVASLNLGVDC